MTIYSVEQIANTWIRNGGNRDGLVLLAVCEVALAESGGDTLARSPSNDYGLWQINGIHFGDGIINSGNWSNPDVNAREAIKLSGNGSNWAAWCTAWLNPAGNCGHGYLAAPQIGSPAYMRFSIVRDALSKANLTGGVLNATTAPNVSTPGVGRAWAAMQHYAAHGAPTHYKNLHSVGSAIWRIAR